MLGFLVAKVGIPSFVVTLAAFLAFQGVVLLLLKGGNIISIRDPIILAIANKNMPPLLGWVFCARRGRRLRRRPVASGTAAAPQRGLITDPIERWSLLRIGALAVLLGIAVARAEPGAQPQRR